MSEVILLDGGLDTASSPLAAKRGGLRACQNYEVGVERGYRRIDGIEIYDGTINPEINNWLKIVFHSDCANGPLTSAIIGQGVVFPNPYSYLGDSIVRVFSYIDLGAGKKEYTLEVELSQTSTVTLDPKKFDVAGVHVEPTDPYDVVYSLGTPRVQSETNVDAVQPIRAVDLSHTQRIAGLFWRNDKLHAIVDCVKITVSGITQFREGGVFNGAYLYVVGNPEPFGEVIYNDGTTFHYIAKGNSIPNVGATITVADGAQQMNLLSFEQAQVATLHVAEHGGIDGWSPVETNRIASYKQTVDCDAASFFAPYNRFAFSNTEEVSVVNSPIPVHDVEIQAGDSYYWDGPDNIIDNTADYATYGYDLSNYYGGLNSVSSPLSCKFDFSGIPANARVSGIQVNIVKKRSQHTFTGPLIGPIVDSGVDSIIYDSEILFSSTGIVSQNKAKPENWEYLTFTQSTYGGTNDLWGSNISLTDMLSPNFKLTITVRNGVPPQTHNAFFIQYVEMIVYYITQTNDVYIYRAPGLTGDGIDMKVVIPHRTIQSGLPATKTAKGQIVIEGLGKNFVESGTPFASVKRAYVTAEGDELRTAPGHAGSLIAVLTTADGPQYLPSSYKLDVDNKRWHSIQASPYAQDNTDISVLCNGVEQAYVWDDRNLLPISTKLDSKYENPTFSVYWNDALILGYDTGTVIFSDVGDPLSFVGGISGATDLNVSDKVTGMLVLKGEALGIFTERTIQAFYGDDVATLVRKTISPNSGAIAYTVCDMGVPVFTDFRGIGTVDAVKEYGDFQRGRWSYNIQNYITPIIQEETRFLGEPTRIICAYPARNKNQYRLCFSDASIITMTLVGEGLEQQFTTQSIYTTFEGAKTLMPVLATEQGVSSGGRDVIFCTLDTNRHNGYVYRVDQGNKFPSPEGNSAGSEIEAWFDLNFNHSLNRPSSTARIDRLAVYGKCKGYANISLNQSVFYGDVGAINRPFVAGDLLTTADKPAKYFMSIIDSACEARDISFRISSSQIEASHTVQAIEVFQSNQRQDDKR